MNNRVLLTLVLVFLAGVTTGMLGMRYGLHDEIHRVVEEATNARENGEDAVLQHFRTELNLTDQQAQQLSVVLDDYQHYYDSLQDQIEELHLRDQIEDLRSTGKSRILEILDPNQRQKFEQMTEELMPTAAK